jgi:hypothetical protein
VMVMVIVIVSMTGVSMTMVIVIVIVIMICVMVRLGGASIGLVMAMAMVVGNKDVGQGLCEFSKHGSMLFLRGKVAACRQGFSLACGFDWIKVD